MLTKRVSLVCFAMLAGIGLSPAVAAPVKSANSRAGGPTTKVVSCADGLTTVTSIIPPPGFNPLTASDADLDQYAYPSRPVNDPEAYEVWKRYVSSPIKRIIECPTPSRTTRHHSTIRNLDHSHLTRKKMYPAGWATAGSSGRASRAQQDGARIHQKSLVTRLAMPRELSTPTLI